jgi:hypothetical protein
MKEIMAKIRKVASWKKFGRFGESASTVAQNSKPIKKIAPVWVSKVGAATRALRLDDWIASHRSDVFEDGKPTWITCRAFIISWPMIPGFPKACSRR